MIYNYAIGRVGAATASIFLNLNTLFSVVGAALFLHESIKSVHLIGFILIVFSGVIMGLERWKTGYDSIEKRKYSWNNLLILLIYNIMGLPRQPQK